MAIGVRFLWDRPSTFRSGSAACSIYLDLRDTYDASLFNATKLPTIGRPPQNAGSSSIMFDERLLPTFYILARCVVTMEHGYFVLHLLSLNDDQK